MILSTMYLIASVVGDWCAGVAGIALWLCSSPLGAVSHDESYWVEAIAFL